MQSLSWLIFLAHPLDFVSWMKNQNFKCVLKSKKEASNIVQYSYLEECFVEEGVDVWLALI